MTAHAGDDRGFDNWFIPILIGAPDTVFPWLNNISFWLLVLGFGPIMTGLLFGESGNGWPLYPPSSNSTYPPGIGMDCTLFGPHLAGMSLLLASINSITTIFNMRAPEDVQATAICVRAAGDGVHAADHPLRPVARLGFRNLCRLPLLNRQSVRPSVSRVLGEGAFLGDVRRSPGR
jgi:hypothetical protein